MSSRSTTADRAELIRALAVLCEAPGPRHDELAASLGVPVPAMVDYTSLFVDQLPPYASIYLDPSGKIGGEARARIAGFWRALHLVPPAEPDHLSSLLGLSAGLVDSAARETNPERKALLEHTQRALTWEHLASWLIPYLMRVEELAPEHFGRWADLVLQVLKAALSGERRFEPPIHLAEAPSGLSESDGLVSYLLTPVRSGLVLTRRDLQRAARDTALGFRIGPRAKSLETLLDQDRDALLVWMVAEARRQADRHASSTIDQIGRLWAQRALDTSVRLTAACGPSTPASAGER